jgi:hypothetical protein
MVLEDVTEFDYTGAQIKLPKILLNGNNICMVSQILLTMTIYLMLLVNTWWRGTNGYCLMIALYEWIDTIKGFRALMLPLRVTSHIKAREVLEVH